MIYKTRLLVTDPQNIIIKEVRFELSKALNEEATIKEYQGKFKDCTITIDKGGEDGQSDF